MCSVWIRCKKGPEYQGEWVLDYATVSLQRYQKHTLNCQVVPDGNSQQPVQDEEQVVVGVGHASGLPHEPRGAENHPGSQPGPDFETNPSAIPPPQFGNAAVDFPDTLRPPSEPRTTEYSVNGAPATSDQPPIPLNKHESRIVPDEHSVIDDPLLRRTPYIVNTNYLVLICTDCRHCVNPARSSEHIRKHHPHCKTDTHFATQVLSKFPELINEEVHPPEVVEPIFGLAIPDEKYTVCTRCRRGYRNVPSWRHHTCERLDIDLEGRSEYFYSLTLAIPTATSKHSQPF